MNPENIAYKKCHHCEGKGYIEIRDCSTEVQYEETCSFCRGTGEIEVIHQNLHQPSNCRVGKIIG